MSNKYLAIGSLAFLLAVTGCANPAGILIDPDITVGERVKFAAGDHIIAGDFIKAPGADIAPCVVMITGSGKYSYRPDFDPKTDYPFWKSVAEAFLDRGISVFFIEKRGINGSTGNWATTDFFGRALDVKYAIDYLKTRTEVEPDKIGVCGHSQGGWICQLAAAEYSGDVAFIVSLAGPACTVKEQVLFDYLNEWKMAGKSPAAIASGLRTQKLMLSFVSFCSKIVKVGQFMRVIDYDPVLIIPKVKCPVYALFGETDKLVELSSNISLWKQGLVNGGNKAYELRVIPGVGHGFWDAKEQRIAPAFLKAIGDWSFFNTLIPTAK